MHRRRLILCALALCVATPVAAQSIVDRVIGDLRRLGYTEFRVGSTLLGRRRVLAVGPSGTREIILNPRTGEILRDFQQSTQGAVLLGGGRRDGNDGRRDNDDDDDDRGGRGGGRDDDDDDGGGGGSDDDDDDGGGDDDDDDGGGGGGGGDNDDDDDD